MKKSLFLCLLLFLCVSCRNGKPVLDEQVSFSNGMWNRFRILEFHPQTTKADRYYDFVIKISVEDDFSYAEIPINTVLTAPDGQVNVMRKSIGILQADGQHYGTAYGDVWTVEKTIHSHKKLKEVGSYTFAVQQLTQYYELEGITAVSCQVLPSKKQ